MLQSSRLILLSKAPNHSGPDLFRFESQGRPRRVDVPFLFFHVKSVSQWQGWVGNGH